MKSVGERVRSFLVDRRQSIALVVALGVGMAFGPAAGSAATSALIGIKNWPKSMNMRVLNWPTTQNVAVTNTPGVSVSNWPDAQNVAVTNSASDPIPVDHAARTPVHVRGATYLPPLNPGTEGPVFYTVPAGKWLTVTAITSDGSSHSAIDSLRVDVYSPTTSLIDIPFAAHLDGDIYAFTGSVAGEWCFAPGTTLKVFAGRGTSENDASVAVNVDGYLTATP